MNNGNSDQQLAIILNNNKYISIIIIIIGKYKCSYSYKTLMSINFNLVKKVLFLCVCLDGFVSLVSDPFSPLLLNLIHGHGIHKDHIGPTSICNLK